MHLIDLTSWQGVLASVLGLAPFSFIAVGIRVRAMQTIRSASSG
ncbi:MAG TPA: hypothetical protein PKD10_09840 [Paracoccaceae bacterium]|nr:hypothetical protein [Paracoccaceae bacterium]